MCTKSQGHRWVASHSHLPIDTLDAQSQAGEGPAHAGPQSNNRQQPHAHMVGGR